MRSRLPLLVVLLTACAAETAVRQETSSPERPIEAVEQAPRQTMTALPPPVVPGPATPVVEPIDESPAPLALRPLDDGWRVSDRLEMAYDPGDMPLEPIARPHPALPFLQEGSVSVGTSSDGYLVRGVQLPLVGDHHRVITTQASRGTNWGAEELVKAIQEAAASVGKEFPGTVLQVGNLARGGGGDIPWSRSHNSGRDADIGFFVKNKAGEVVTLTDLVRLGRTGYGSIAGDSVRFDAARNWSLVRALLRNPSIRLQYIFVSKPLKAMMLEVAARRKESAALIALAMEIVRQPVGAAPHDDHLHIRIVCPKEDLAEGCVDTLKLPEGYEPPMAGRLANVGKAKKLLRAEAAPERRSAVQLLRILAARETGVAVAALLGDSDTDVRYEAARTVAAFDADETAAQVATQLGKEVSPRVAVALVNALVTLGGNAAREALIDAVRRGRTLIIEGEQVEPLSLRKLAATALRRFSADGKVVKALVDALVETDEEIRGVLVHTLEVLTNQKLEVSSTAAAFAEVSPVQKGWAAWFERHRGRTPTEWALDGFRAAGIAIRKFDKKAVPLLLDGLTAAEPTSTNAVRHLIAITRHRADSTLSWPATERYAYWKRWLKRHGYLRRR